ncbi:MAG TPA: acetyl-CoA carboxylase biotin carboxyl carrier protein [Alphaproteobacteria bacterium]|nr:acetyl-CoA carboxylase biotin carboxyl carrier protein [Alphaproteobacteria bacterium]
MANPIDTKIISKLADILNKSNLTQLEYEDETVRISLGRQSGAPVLPQVVVTQPVEQEKPKEEEKELPKEVENLIQDYRDDENAVKSPMVGVVYLAPNQTSPNFVKVGDDVKAGDTVCLIEAMKTFNPVKAHKSGRVTKILVEAGDPVEYGAPLIVIE